MEKNNDADSISEAAGLIGVDCSTVLRVGGKGFSSLSRAQKQKIEAKADLAPDSKPEPNSQIQLLHELLMAGTISYYK